MTDKKNVRLTEGYQPLQKGYQPVSGGLSPTAPSSGTGVNVGGPAATVNPQPSSTSGSGSTQGNSK